jgi:hypothetical protein
LFLSGHNSLSGCFVIGSRRYAQRIYIVRQLLAG